MKMCILTFSNTCVLLNFSWFLAENIIYISFSSHSGLSYQLRNTPESTLVTHKQLPLYDESTKVLNPRDFMNFNF